MLHSHQMQWHHLLLHLATLQHHHKSTAKQVPHHQWPSPATHLPLLLRYGKRLLNTTPHLLPVHLQFCHISREHQVLLLILVMIPELILSRNQLTLIVAQVLRMIPISSLTTFHPRVKWMRMNRVANSLICRVHLPSKINPLLHISAYNKVRRPHLYRHLLHEWEDRHNEHRLVIYPNKVPAVCLPRQHSPLPKDRKHNHLGQHILGQN